MRMIFILHSAAGVLNEHSAAISNVFVDADEIITDDYDGVVIARRIDRHSRTRRVFAAAKRRKSASRSGQNARLEADNKT